MTRTSGVFAILVGLPVMMLWRALAIGHHNDGRGLNRRGANWRYPQHERNRQNTGREHIHALCRLRRIGQRITRSAVPAKPSDRPPMAKASSHHVLKFSWFFQSMMWRLQKKS